MFLNSIGENPKISANPYKHAIKEIKMTNTSINLIQVKLLNRCGTNHINKINDKKS